MDVQAPLECYSINIVEMMKRLGIELGGGAVPRLSLNYATVFRRCEACTSKQTCHDWLESAPQSVAFAPRFCPSADILFELQVDQPCVNRSRMQVEPATMTSDHASIADLERLEDELDEVLIAKSADDAAIDDLRRRRSHLRDEIERLRYEADAKERPH